VVYLPVLGAAIVVALLLGGRLGALAEIRLRAIWLFYVAIALQLAAFPPMFFPWTTADSVARPLWLASYGCLVAAAVVNRHLRGIVLVIAGMASNLVAVLANGGVMPTLPSAARGAGHMGAAKYNSVTNADPSLGWLVDRWAAPDWIPLANVFSVGDVVLALGAFVLVLTAMDVPLLRRIPRPRIALG
jgi:hypothetical protein